MYQLILLRQFICLLIRSYLGSLPTTTIMSQVFMATTCYISKTEHHRVFINHVALFQISGRQLCYEQKQRKREKKKLPKIRSSYNNSTWHWMTFCQKIKLYIHNCVSACNIHMKTKKKENLKYHLLCGLHVYRHPNCY